MSSVIFESNEEIRECCDKWVEILKLQEWDIMLSIERAKNFAYFDNQGEIDYKIELGSAVIKVLHPDDWPDDTPFEYDMEKTLVHELMHLHFAAFEPEDKNSLNYKMWERTVEFISKTLVDLEREGSIDVEFTFDSDSKNDIKEKKAKQTGGRKNVKN